MNQNIDDNQELDLSLRQILSQNIRKFRKDLHLTQERLAENADISLPYLSDIEHCKTWVSDRTLIKLANALKKTPSDLLNETKIVEETSKDIQIADLIYIQKKKLSKAIIDICDDTLSELLKL
ncbi:MAG: helix-turn-helix transcriptional regulator [Treponema bryantii]|nr:helix-turn-helix transcriptional regulator [Treponema bryantii]